MAQQLVDCLETQLTGESQPSAAAANAQHIQGLKQGLKEITVEPYSQDLILSTVFSQAVRPGESLEEMEKRHERMSKEELTAEELEGAKAKLEVLKVAKMVAMRMVSVYSPQQRLHESPSGMIDSCGVQGSDDSEKHTTRVIKKAQAVVDHLQAFKTVLNGRVHATDESVDKAKEAVKNAEQELQAAAAAPYTKCFDSVTQISDVISQCLTFETPDLTELRPEDDLILNAVFTEPEKPEKGLMAKVGRLGASVGLIAEESAEMLDKRYHKAQLLKKYLDKLKTRIIQQHQDDDGGAVKIHFHMPKEEAQSLKEKLFTQCHEGKEGSQNGPTMMESEGFRQVMSRALMTRFN